MPRRRATRRNIAHHHAEWLSLIEISGPFLSIPVLKEVFPEGLEKPDDESDVKAQLRADYELWLDNQTNPEHQRDWIKLVLDLALGFDAAEEYVRQADTIDERHTARIREHHETLKPDLVLLDTESGDVPKARLLVQIVPRTQNLEKPLREHRWKASPATRMAELLRNCADENVRLGLVTNGEDWMLVHAPRKGTSGYALWRADLWFEEDKTLRAFRTLLSVDRFFGRPEDTLESLYDRSEKDQFEVTETLGLQVRDAVELLVDTIDTIDRQRDRKLLADYPERRLYEAVVSLMMRLVFILFAEENDLLPAEDRVYQQNYALSPLLDQLQADHDKHGPQSLQHRTSAWHRLLATFRAIHGGVDHEDLHLPAYGGDLFDPDHFPFFEGRARGGDWRNEQADPLPVDDLTVMRLLESLLLLEVGGTGNQGITTRRLSYSSLGIEQIGNVYESLLDHTVVRADDIVLGLHGKRGLEPEVPLGRIEEAAERGESDLVKLLKEETQKQPAQIKRLLEEGLPDNDPRWRQVVGGDNDALERIKPYAGLVRDDHVDMPMVREPSAVYVTQTSSRRDTGTQYTPPSFTGPIVRYALEPLVYEGPSEGRPEEEWQLKSPREILALKICDLAMGSAAFLVQTCRYLGNRLVEGWEEIEQANPGKILVSPEGDLSTGDPSESIIPRDTSERIASARRYIAERCVYGIDKDPMAVEMAKLSMWLVTMQKGKPFSFLDHALKCGDALLGITKREQLERFDLKPENSKQISIFEKTLSEALGKALDKRIELESIAVNDIRDAEEKARLLKEAEESLEIVRLAGDLLIGAGIASCLSDYPSFTRLRNQLSAQLATALELPPGVEREKTITALKDNSKDLLDAGAISSSGERRPLHWLLEFPEVLANFGSEPRRGFTAFVGNPPFLGGARITEVLGESYNSYLSLVHPWSSKKSDLAGHFFCRAYEIQAARATAGLIGPPVVTDTVTRKASLDWIVQQGGVIYRARTPSPWPGPASVMVVVVWFSRPDWNGIRNLDDVPVGHISTSLDSQNDFDPNRINQNIGYCFQGPNPLGTGFVVDNNTAEEWITDDNRNSQVVRPYITGKSVNQFPPNELPLNHIVFFAEMDEDNAKSFPSPFKHILENVKPDRETKNREKYPRMVNEWWKYWHGRQGLFRAISGLEYMFVAARVTKYIALTRVPSTWICNDKTIVFASQSWPLFGVLQSSIHNNWARRFGSYRGETFNYVVKSSFETFPMPRNKERDELALVATSYYRSREEIMNKHGLGLTSFYNKIHDPGENSDEIRDFRNLVEQLDKAVISLYGWDDLDPSHDHIDVNGHCRFSLSPLVASEVDQRLETLNGHYMSQGASAELDILYDQARNPSLFGTPVADDMQIGLDLE